MVSGTITNFVPPWVIVISLQTLMHDTRRYIKDNINIIAIPDARTALFQHAVFSKILSRPAKFSATNELKFIRFNYIKNAINVCLNIYRILIIMINFCFRYTYSSWNSSRGRKTMWKNKLKSFCYVFHLHEHLFLFSNFSFFNIYLPYRNFVIILHGIV